MAFVVGSIIAKASIKTNLWQKGLKKMNSLTKNMSEKSKKRFGIVGKAIRLLFAPLRLLIKIGKSAVKIAAKASALGFAGFVAGSTLAVKKANDYAKALGNVDSILAGTGMQIEDLSARVLRLSPQLGDVTGNMEALYQAISAGATTTESAMAMLEASTKLAGAVLIESATAVDVLSTATQGFTKHAVTAEKAADLLTKTIKLGKTTGPELAASLGEVIPTFNSAGLSMEELTAATAALTKGGLSTSKAVTKLQSLMVGFIKPSTAMKKALEKTEFGTAQNLLASVGLTGALEFLTEAYGGNLEVLGDLANRQEAMDAIQILTMNNSREFTQILAEMGGAAGATNEAFSDQEKTFLTLKNAAMGLMTELGILLKPMAEIVALDLTEKLQGFREFIKSPEGIDQVAGALERLALGVSTVYVAVEGISGVILDRLSEKFTTAGESAESLQGHSALVAAAIGGVGKAMGLVAYAAELILGRVERIVNRLNRFFEKRDAREVFREEKKAIGQAYNNDEIDEYEYATLMGDAKSRRNASRTAAFEDNPIPSFREIRSRARETRSSIDEVFDKLPEGAAKIFQQISEIWSGDIRNLFGNPTLSKPEGPSVPGEGETGGDENETEQPITASGPVDPIKFFGKPSDFKIPEMKSANTRSGELAAVQEHYDMLLFFARGHATSTLKLTKELAEKEKEIRERYRQQYIDGVSSAITNIETGFSIASSALTSLSQIANSELETQMDTIQSKRDSDIAQVRADYAERLKLAKGDKVAQKKILEEQKADEKKVNDEYADQEDKIRKKHFESTKALRISEVIMSTGQAIMSAWQSSAALGPIGGPIAAGLLTGLILFAFEKRMRQIKEQEYVSARALGGMASGLTRVNERGGEIITLPDRSQVIPHDISRQIARNAFKEEPIVINVNLDGAIFSSDVDVDTIGETVADVLRERRVGT